MCDYYSNAHITISAAASENPTESFLDQAPAEFWSSKVRPASERMEGSESIICRPVQPLRDGYEAQAPLCDRAWTFQESALSARLLHYTGSEIMYHCAAGLVSETGVSMTDVRQLETPAGLTWPSFGLSSQSTEDTILRWSEILGNYTGRSLTNANDRLPAISGVATLFSTKMNCEYFAGLWEEYLLQQLLWSCILTQTSTAGKDVQQVKHQPSWSWASISHRIYFSEDWIHYVPTASIEQTVCPLRGPNRFGEVLSGSMTLDGRLLLATLTIRLPGRGDLHPQQVNIGFRYRQGAVRFYLRCDDYLAPCSGFQAGDAALTRGRWRDQRANHLTARRARNKLEIPSSNMETPLLVYLLYIAKSPDDLELNFLCLGQPAGLDGSYVRIGMATTSNEYGDGILDLLDETQTQHVKIV
jgi:hypothetical protein